MRELKKIYKNTTNIEKFVTLLAVTTLIIIQLMTDSSLIAFGTATLGIGYVLCVKYKSRYAMVLGAIQCTLYALLAFTNKVYGDVFLNTYNVCFLMFGYFQWKKNSVESEVKVRNINKKEGSILFIITLITYLVLFTVLSKLGGFKAYLDAFNTTFSCIAMALCCLRYKFQWFYWNCVNISSLVLYTTLLMSGANVLPMVLMFSVYLLNSLHATYIWYGKKIKK